MSDTDLMTAEDLAREITVMRIQRRNCCDPYDCMHHEGCDSEGACGSCSRMDLLWQEFEVACKQEGKDEQTLLSREERRIEGERLDFYARMNEMGYDLDDGPAFWTDEE